jgi:anhydro-N-acetylmuramic acid kinase
MTRRRWAAQGGVDAELLAALLASPFWPAAPQEHRARPVHPGWLQQHLRAHGQLSATTVQATLTEFTAPAAPRPCSARARTAAACWSAAAAR